MMNCWHGWRSILELWRILKDGVRGKNIRKYTLNCVENYPECCVIIFACAITKAISLFIHQRRIRMSTTKKKPNKSRLTFMLRYLIDHTDDDHPLSIYDMINIMEQNGCGTVTRKTATDDI